MWALPCSARVDAAVDVEMWWLPDLCVLGVPYYAAVCPRSLVHRLDASYDPAAIFSRVVHPAHGSYVPVGPAWFSA